MRSLDRSRQIPKQQRSRDKVGLILDAAIQVLERNGERGFNTNAVAERAGVSIGTLYRYFPDKEAVLIALAEREIEGQQAERKKLMKGDPTGLAPDRAFIRAFLHAFGGRTRARQVVMNAWFARVPSRVEPPVRESAGATGQPLTRIQAFVLSQALLGAMRAAVLEGADFLLKREFEDELVRLSRTYRGLPSTDHRT